MTSDKLTDDESMLAMKDVCEINILRTQYGEDAYYGWSIRPLGYFPDECVGAPSGRAIRDLTECICKAISEAKEQGFTGARIWSFMNVTIDTALSDNGFDMERAEKLLARLTPQDSCDQLPGM